MKYLVALETSSKKAVLSRAGDYDLIVVDAQDYSAEIDRLKAGGAKVLSYLNVGAIESERPYFAEAKKKGLLICEYNNWDGEWWAKAQEAAWREMILKLASRLRLTGVDGFWIDNLDIYYMAKEEWKWSQDKVSALYENLSSILEGLHAMGTIMTNGGDVFVKKLLRDEKRRSFIDMVNQETVFSSIRSYSGKGTFGRQNQEDMAYYREYVETADRAGKGVFLLEYTTDTDVRSRIEEYCRRKGFSACISTTLKLGADLSVKTAQEAAGASQEITGAGGKEKTGADTKAQQEASATAWDILVAMAKYDGSPTAHEDVIDDLKKYAGKVVNKSDAWCTETIMAAIARCNALPLVGGYSSSAAKLKAAAKKAGIWHDGSFGILPGDIVLYGKSANHTEIAAGKDANISGNYNGGCSRRKRSGRNIDGYVRPKYAKMPEMDELQLTIAACDVLLGVYGSGEDRERMLSVFGAENAGKIQEKVNALCAYAPALDLAMAAYVIAGRAGKGDYRKKRLGDYASRAQTRTNSLWELRGKSIEQVAQLVLQDEFGKGAVRELLLEFCGYDPAEVQKRVNELVKERETSDREARYRIHFEHFFRKDESAYGACTAIYQYAGDGKTIDKCVLIDTAMGKASGEVIEDLKAQGVKRIDAVVLSHAHGDHYGGLSSICKAFPVGKLYLPDTTELDKHQKGYGNKLRREAERIKNHQYLKPGDSFIVGGIRCDCVFQCRAADLEEHDAHHFVNNMSIVTRFTVGGKFVFHTAGDLQNPGNHLMVKAVEDLKCHALEFQWHTDGNATSEEQMKATRPLICVSNYHHKDWHSGRTITKKRAEAVGAKCYSNADDGQIFVDIEGDDVAVTTTTTKKRDHFTI